MTDKREYSDKSYVTAAVLAGIFGVIGIHHFYVGRWGHGLFDLSMTVLGVIAITSAIGFSALMVSGILLLLLDLIHTVYFMYKLIVGECGLRCCVSGRTLGVDESTLSTYASASQSRCHPPCRADDTLYGST